MKVQCETCGTPAEAPPLPEKLPLWPALENAGWIEVRVKHCKTCDCVTYYCPKCWTSRGALP